MYGDAPILHGCVELLAHAFVRLAWFVEEHPPSGGKHYEGTAFSDEPCQIGHEFRVEPSCGGKAAFVQHSVDVEKNHFHMEGWLFVVEGIDKRKFGNTLEPMAKQKRQEASTWPVVSVERLWDQGNRHERVKQHDDGTWRISELREVVRHQPVFDVPLAFLSLRDHTFDLHDGLVTFAQHMKHVQEADLAFPIIFDEFGGILDGRHRLVKALLLGHDTIKGVRVPKGSTPTIPA